MNQYLNNINDLPENIRPTVVMMDSMFDEIFLVGGAVRDSLIGISTYDLDFAVPNDVDEIDSIMRANPILSVRSDARRYGTISATAGEFEIQVTTYRQEEYSNASRKPVVLSVSDIDSDLSRRDFTINAIALSRDEIVDPYNGKSDIQKKVIRMIGNKDAKFKEDPLRILRAFRFVSTYGYDIEEGTLEAATNNKNNFLIVSSERMGEELKKLLNGKYWADTLNELSDSGVLSKLLEVFDLTYRITGDDTRHEFEKFSASELEGMNASQRWQYLIRVLDYAERASGVTSSDISSTAENVMIKAQASKELKSAVLQSFSNYEKSDVPYLSNSSEKKSQINLLKKSDDPRYMIEEAKYLSLLGREDLSNKKYASAKKNYLEALKVTEDNYRFILGFREEEKRYAGLRGISPYYIARLKHYFASLILDEKLYQKFKSTELLTNYLIKQYKTSFVNKSDVSAAVHAAIAHAYKQNIHDSKLESYTSFLRNPRTLLSDEQRKRELLSYIEKQIRDDSVPPKEKSKLYLEKAKLAAKGKEKKEYGLDYYDPYIDGLYNLMLSKMSIEDFYGVYEEFEEAIDRYIEITEEERKGWAGRRKRDLTSASSYVYALSIAKTLEQKVLISNNIVRDYGNAGRGFEKNRLRYQVYVDWFGFIGDLFNAEYSPGALKDLFLKIKRSNSISYVDMDEAYLAEYKPDIVRKRELIKDSAIFISLLMATSKQSDVIFKDSTVMSIANLLKEGLIGKNDAFTLFKNFLSASENQTVRSERIELTDEELRQKQYSELEGYLNGESETVEYKSSWIFDVNKYKFTEHKMKENNPELMKEVVKNIAGFMNKAGGVLFIGVEDDCTVSGLEEADFLMQSSKDPRKKLDNLILDIGNIIKERLGREIYALLSVDAIKYDDKTVIRIKIPIASEPVIYRDGENEQYYVRSGTATTSAGIKAAIEKVKN